MAKNNSMTAAIVVALKAVLILVTLGKVSRYLVIFYLHS